MSEARKRLFASGFVSGMKGYKHTEEAKQKVSNANKGKTAWNKGRVCTEEEKKKNSERQKELYKNGYINPMQGRNQSLYVKKRVSEANKGRKSWNALTDEVYIERCREIHSDKYDYSITKLSNGVDCVIEYICPIHGRVSQNAMVHLYDRCGCPKCSPSNRVSLEEISVFKFIKSLLSVEVLQSQKGLFSNKKKEIDIWIPSLRIGIEFDGIYWHSDRFSLPNAIKQKQDLSIESNLRLINIFEDEWIYKQEIVKSRLKAILGVQTEKVFARKCGILEISNSEAKHFLDKNHLQGGNSCCYKAYGLKYNNELVSVMTFSKPRKGFGNGIQREGLYELLKFASKLNLTVVGGASKLLSHFIKQENPKEIYSFADRRWSDGKLYEKLGFERVSVTEPSYFYIIEGRRKSRFGFQKKALVEQGYDPSKSESQIMKERGIEKVYDAGTFKYVLKVCNS